MEITDKYPWMNVTNIGNIMCKVSDPKSEHTFYVHVDNYGKFLSRDSTHDRTALSDIVLHSGRLIKSRYPLEELLDGYYEVL